MLPFADLGGEQLTVSTSSIGITESVYEDSDNQPMDVRRAVFTHVSGGDIYHRSDGSAATASGGAGEIPQDAGSQWEITGIEDIKNWRAIKKTGESDATISVRIYGPKGG